MQLVTLWFDPEQERNRHTRTLWRQSLYDIDRWAIPKGSPKRDDAYRFLASSSERQKALSVASLAPDEHGHLIWKFTRSGTVTFACLQSGHLEAGMRGAVAVQ